MMGSRPTRCPYGHVMTRRPNDMGERLWCQPCEMASAPQYQDRGLYGMVRVK